MKRLIATTLVAFGLAFAAPSFAQQTGTTSGPAAKKNVEPSTATEKKYEGKHAPGTGAPAAAGDPGVEAKPGTEGGKAGQPGK